MYIKDSKQKRRMTWKYKHTDRKKRIRQVRDALNKCRDLERIEKCAEILGV
jgi:hypothetical protein